jgi:putative membrane protein
MISPCDLHVPRMLRNLGRPLALLVWLDIVVVVAYVFFHQRWLALPNLPLAIGGGALGVLLGFRNNISYARWWEARTLWGRIVNHSRCLGRQAVAYGSVGDRPQDRGLIQDNRRRIVY